MSFSRVDNAQRFERTTINIAINIEVPSSIIQATNSVPGSFVLLCRPCAASMISKSSSSWKFEMGTPTLIWEQKYMQEWYMKNYMRIMYETCIQIFHYKLYDSKNDCKPLTNHWKLKCMYRKRRTEVTLIEFYFCTLNISKKWVLRLQHKVSTSVKLLYLTLSDVPFTPLLSLLQTLYKSCRYTLRTVDLPPLPWQRLLRRYANCSSVKLRFIAASCSFFRSVSLDGWWLALARDLPR